jgi:hypothetical protein
MGIKEEFSDLFTSIHSKLSAHMSQETELKDVYDQYNAQSKRLLDALEKEESQLDSVNKVVPEKQGRMLVTIRSRIESLEPLYNTVLQLNGRCTNMIQQRIPFQVCFSQLLTSLDIVSQVALPFDVYIT